MKYSQERKQAVSAKLAPPNQWTVKNAGLKAALRAQMQFEWDSDKAAANVSRHGVSFSNWPCLFFLTMAASLNLMNASIMAKNE